MLSELISEMSENGMFPGKRQNGQQDINTKQTS